MALLHVADYIVFAILLLVSALVGPFYMWRDRNKKATSESYFVGNRALRLLPTAASLFASFWSAIALIGIPAELYTGGAKFFMAIVGQIIGITLGSFVAVPMMYKLQLISTYQYMELRFRSPLVRKLGTVAGMLTSLFALAVTTYAPCVALEAVTPIPIWASIVCVAAVALIYTALGGIRAVVLVDLIQALVMFFGVLIAMIIGYTKIEGGFAGAMAIAWHGDRLNFFDFNPDPRNTYSFYTMVLPGIIFSAGIYATSQAAVQRYSALSSLKLARRSVLLMIPQLIIFKALLFFLALSMFSYYDAKGCDPLAGGLIYNSNQLTTYYVMEILNYPGLIGLWFAALFSGALSSMSTGYNSVAAIIWEDFLKGRYEKKLTPTQIELVLKSITLVLGVLSCLLAMSFKAVPGSIIKLTMSTVSVFGAAVFIIYLSGALLPFANSAGALVGMLSATVITGCLSGGQMYYRLGNERIVLPTKVENCPVKNQTTLPAYSSNNYHQLFSDSMNATTYYENFTISNSKQAATLDPRDPANLSPALRYLFSISYFLFPFLAVLAGVTIAGIVSLCTGGLDSAKFVEQRYLIVPNCFADPALETAPTALKSLPNDDINSCSSDNCSSVCGKKSGVASEIDDYDNLVDENLKVTTSLLGQSKSSASTGKASAEENCDVWMDAETGYQTQQKV